MNENLQLDSDFTYETQQQQNDVFINTTAPAGSAVTSLNGLSGPNVTFTGGTTGLSFSAASPNIVLTGTLAIANGGTGATSAAAARTALSAAASGVNTDITQLNGASQVDVTTAYKKSGVQVIGARGAAVADAAGGATVDTEARAAINALLARLRAHGLIAP